MGALLALLPTILTLLNNPDVQKLLPLIAELGKTAFPGARPEQAVNAGAAVFDFNAVKWVQVALNLLGKKVEIDGIYGEATKKAITEFQVDHKLDADGWAGTLTVAALQKELLGK